MSENNFKDEFQRLCGEKMCKGTIEHGDWDPDVPWEWAAYQIVEELADSINYSTFMIRANNLKNMIQPRVDSIKIANANINIYIPEIGVQLLRFINQYGDPEIVKQLKEGSFKLCPKKESKT